MSDEMVTLEVDGQSIEARPGSMLIDATDAAGIYIPRFCYHKQLSVAANCRMCLVEVERAPKALPACATPVMDGMKVFTRSDSAIAAQKATMEFLLINHPLDCPICDQGGECELQDLAMGYGSDVSRYNEGKRVVRDKDIGPLVQTDMTRCIHCTRCVRFGEEIAGLRELGTTGRGEYMEIGTYVEKAMDSELSGNVIDLCPVGALTSKPYRYSARAWELQQRDSIAPHDCVGSNVHVHVKGQVVKRVVPKEHRLINEVWLSDRDRYSYEAVNSAARLTAPRIKEDGVWREVDWDTALAAVGERLKAVEGEQIGALVSPSSTTEECFLLQRLLRVLGSHNIDHRLRQVDFSDQNTAPSYPFLGVTLEELERCDAVLLIGSNPRHEQPLLNHRIRKAALGGAKVMAVNSFRYDFNFAVDETIIIRPSGMSAELAAIARATAELAGREINPKIADFDAGQQQQAIAAALHAAERPIVLLGNAAGRHRHYAQLAALAAEIAIASGAALGTLTDGANAAGAWLSGAVPHRGPGGRQLDKVGLDAGAMADGNINAFILLGIEPDLDCANAAKFRAALNRAGTVIALTAFADSAQEALADILLPIAPFTENEGTFINVCGDWQTFESCVKPQGEAKPAWKIFRALGAHLRLPGFEAARISDVTAEVQALAGNPETTAVVDGELSDIAHPADDKTMEAFVDIPIYAVDELVRHADSLQQTQLAGKPSIGLSANDLTRLGLQSGDEALVKVNGTATTLTAIVEERLPENTCLIHAGKRPSALVATSEGPLEISPA